MSREVKRVPQGFAPPQELWFGYVLPSIPCGLCNGEIENCKLCWGEGRVWPKVEVPEGEAYQMWETTSEGSPISPTFDTPEELARWLADNNTSAFGSQTASYDAWLRMIHAEWAPSAVIMTSKNGTKTLQSGVSATPRNQSK